MSRDVESVTCWLLRRCSGGKVSKEIGAMVYCGDGSNQSGKGWLRTSIGDKLASTWMDRRRASFWLRLSRSATMRKRRRRFLTRAPTAERHRRCASSEGFLGGRSKSSRRLFSNQSIPPLPPTGATSSPRPGTREEMDGGFEFERWKGGTSEGSLECKKEQARRGPQILTL